ncbi:MAG: hypothetical protein PHE20_02905 [Patescibacteria group bacterium]|nr:hypothetical protein [Patescibacteria group bacterium]
MALRQPSFALTLAKINYILNGWAMLRKTKIIIKDSNSNAYFGTANF